MVDFETSNSKSDVSKSIVENYFFLENYVTLEGAQPLPLLLVIKKGFMILIILSNYQYM